jgi:hypothetical protein
LRQALLRIRRYGILAGCTAAEHGMQAHFLTPRESSILGCIHHARNIFETEPTAPIRVVHVQRHWWR